MVEYILQSILLSGEVFDESSFKDVEIIKKVYLGKNKRYLHPDIKMMKVMRRKKGKKDKIVSVVYNKPTFVKFLMNVVSFKDQYLNIKKNEIGIVRKHDEYSQNLELRLRPFDIEGRELERLLGIKYERGQHELPIEILVRGELSEKELEYINKHFKQDF